MTAIEERELRRVWNLLSLYKEKKALGASIKDLKSERDIISVKKDESRSDGELRLFEERLQAMQEQIESLEGQMSQFVNDPQRLVRPEDVKAMLLTLDMTYFIDDEYVREVVWEVDDDLDGGVNWDEMQILFKRNLMANSGLEGSFLFHLVYFLIYDQDETGKVSVDNVMNLVYERYGREKMEEKLRQIFGDDLNESEGEVLSLSFSVSSVFF